MVNHVERIANAHSEANLAGRAAMSRAVEREKIVSLSDKPSKGDHLLGHIPANKGKDKLKALRRAIAHTNPLQALFAC